MTQMWIFEKENDVWNLKFYKYYLNFDFGVSYPLFLANGKQLIYCSSEDMDVTNGTIREMPFNVKYIPLDLWAINLDDYSHVQIINLTEEELGHSIPTPDGKSIYFLYKVWDGRYYRIDDLDGDGIWTENNYVQWDDIDKDEESSIDYEQLGIYTIIFSMIVVILILIFYRYKKRKRTEIR
jgi:hypothetical protein